MPTQKWLRQLIVALEIVLTILATSSLSPVYAADCTVEAFTVSPNSSPQPAGTALSLYGKGNCSGGIRASRFNIDGTGFGEDAGSAEQNETWAIPAGDHTICFEIAGGSNGDWSNGARNCMNIRGEAPAAPSVSICDPSFYPNMQANFLQTVPPAPAYLDLSGDGFIDLTDYSIYVRRLTAECGGSTQPQPTAVIGNPIPAPQQGGMNIESYCLSIGYTGTTHGADAYSWVCTRDGSQPQPIDVDSVCRQNHGNALPYAGLTNVSDPFSWYCASTPQGRPGSGASTPPPNNGGGSNNPGNCSIAPVDYGSSTPFSSYNLRINAPNGLNIRSGPGTNYCIIGRAVDGGNFEIINDTIAGWYQIRFRGGAGWVSAAYVVVTLLNENNSNTPVPDFSIIMLEANSQLIVRDQPTINGDADGIIRPGTAYEVIGKNGSSYWLQINLGWVCRTFTTTNLSTFTIPITDTSREDCSGNVVPNQQVEIPREYTIYCTFEMNALTYQLLTYSQDPTQYLIPMSSPRIVEKFFGLLEALGLVTDLVDTFVNHPPDQVIINIYKLSSGQKYVLEVVLKRNGQVLNRSSEEMNLEDMLQFLSDGAPCRLQT